MADQLIQIPIVQITNAISAVVLVYLSLRAFKIATFPAFQAFAWALFFGVLTMIPLSLPGTLVTDYMYMQYTTNVGYFFYGIMMAFFLRMAVLFTVPQNQILSIFTPAILILISAILFVWQSLMAPAVETAILYTFLQFPHIQFVEYPNSGPFIISTLYGVIGIVVFFSSSAIFFLKLRFKDPALRNRSFRFGAGFAFAGITAVFNFIIGILPGLTFFLLISGGTGLASVSMLYWGTKVKVSE